MISEKLNSLIWSRASLDERRRFLDAIGMNSLIEAIPPSWTPLLTEHFAVRAPAPSNSFDIPADLSIPEFMRRTRMDNEEKKHE